MAAVGASAHCQARKALLDMVALDLDGTLLDEHHKVTAESVEVLQALSRRGVLIALCSGRSALSMQATAKALGLASPIPVSCFNGACSRLARSPGWLADASDLARTIHTREAVDKVIQVTGANGLALQYYVGDDICVVCKTEEHFDLVRKYRELAGVDAHVLLDSYEEAIQRGLPYKMLVLANKVDETLSLLQEALPQDLVTLVRGSPPWFVEVLKPGTNKGAGFRELCTTLGLPLETVVAFGDGDNDIEFLQAAGLGIAMHNARPTLKAVADRITERPHTDSGVAHELKKLEEEGKFQLPAPYRVPCCKAQPTGTNYIIRRVSAEDVVDLREKVLWPGRLDMCRLAEDALAVHLGASEVSGCGADGNVQHPLVGVLSLYLPTETDGHRAQFRKLAVHPDHQQQGIGRALVNVAIAEARLHNLTQLRAEQAPEAPVLFCHAREAQASFYEGLGFSRCGEPFSKYGEQLYVEMEALLAGAMFNCCKA